MTEYFDESRGLYLPAAFKEAVENGADFQQMSSLLESMAMLELNLEDAGWDRMSGENGSIRDFSNRGRKYLQNEAYLFWLKNPLIANAVETKTNYIFDKGFSYKAPDEKVQECLDMFMNDNDNKRELTTLQAQQIKSAELQIYANLYFVFFVNEMNGLVKVRSIPDSEIEDIIVDPDDSKKPLWYKRVRTRKVYNFDNDTYDSVDEIKYYSDWKRPESSIDPPPNKIAKGQVYHIKVNCLSHNKFGVSEIYRAMDWAKAYNKFLEDLASVWATLSKFPVKNKSKGGPGVIANQQKQIQSALANLSSDAIGGETNPAPAAGSVWLENMASSYQPMEGVKGASVNAEDGRRLLLMVCAATGMMEPFFGDPATANLATMKAMMEPMLKRFGSRQELWKSIFKDIFDFVIDQSIQAPSGILDGKESVDAYNNIIYELNGESKEVEIDFPEMETKDNVKMIEAIAKVSDKFLLREKDLTRVLMNLLEIDRADEILEEMYPEGEEGVNTKPKPHGVEGENMNTSGKMDESAMLNIIESLKERLEEYVGESSGTKGD